MTIQQEPRSLAPRVVQADRIGQGTSVEQARAVAEVEAQVIVAQRRPRDVDRAVADSQRSCGQMSLAEKAFFRFSRGDGQVSGPSVQLAREIARCWGNFQSGLVELRRDDLARQSEMMAWAWDVETNYRTSTTFIVPHIRDTKRGPVDLTDMRDIYENNANMGARRLREMIFDALPGWYTEDAVQSCMRTLGGDGQVDPERIAKCIAGFAALGVTAQQLVRKLGSPQDKWTAYDLATLTVIYRSLQRNEISKDEEFGTPGLSAAAVMAEAGPAPQNGGAGDQERSDAPAAAAGVPAAPAAPPPAERPTKAALGKLLAHFPFPNEDDVESLLQWKAGGKGTLKELTQTDVEFVTGYLQLALDNAQGDPEAASGEIWRQYRADHPETRQQEPGQ
jgi:hypothetical protein